jgi:hypothetical protein
MLNGEPRASLNGARLTQADFEGDEFALGTVQPLGPRETADDEPALVTVFLNDAMILRDARLAVARAFGVDKPQFGTTVKAG